MNKEMIESTLNYVGVKQDIPKDYKFKCGDIVFNREIDLIQIYDGENFVVLKPKLKLFVSMPMRGRSDEEIKKDFAKIQAEFGEDYDIIDSFNSELEIPESIIHDENKKRAYYLGHSIKKLAQADKILFMPGWLSANGCYIEHEIAQRYFSKDKIMYYTKRIEDDENNKKDI